VSLSFGADENPPLIWAEFVMHRVMWGYMGKVQVRQQQRMCGVCALFVLVLARDACLTLIAANAG
jgi:hypothetical protein